MTTRTVTVQTEDEQEVDICDHCSLADEDADLGPIVEFTPPTRGDGSEAGDLHFHRSCLADMGQGDLSRPLDEAVADADADGWSHDTPPVLVFRGHGVFWGAVALSMILVGSFAVAANGITSLPVVSVGGGVLLLAVGLLEGRSNATEEVFA